MKPISKKVVGIASAAILLLPACGSGDSGPSGAKELDFKLLTSSIDRTGDVGTSRMAITMGVEGAEDEALLAGGGLATFEGLVDWETDSFQMEMSLDGALGELADEAGGMLSMMEMEMRVVDGVAYMKMPMFGEGWMEMPAGDESMTEMPDPGSMLAQIEDISKPLEIAGTEELRGTETTVYEGEIDGAKLAELSGDTGVPAEMLEDMEVPLRVWLDGDGLIRKYEMRMEVSDAMDVEDFPDGFGEDATLIVALELWDFGVEVEIEAPPADEIQSMDDVMGGFGLDGLTEEFNIDDIEDLDLDDFDLEGDAETGGGTN